MGQIHVPYVQSDMPDTSGVNTRLLFLCCYPVASAQAPGVNSPSYYSILRWYIVPSVYSTTIERIRITLMAVPPCVFCL